MQAEVNIGMVGHVDHGKTSLTKALTGKWTDTHSEEVKRGITIKIGYADVSFYKCENEKCGSYSTSEKCGECGGKAKFSRKVSFLDAPGHETLMTTAIAASSIIDGAVLVIAANETCPQPQTFEHLTILDILGIKRVVIVQNKIDLVTREKALENYKQIKEFVKGSIAEKAPIIPIAAHFGANIPALIEAIEQTIPTPKRDETKPARMYVTRSFDVNKPGTDIPSLSGGVIGGSLLRGVLKEGDEVEIRPGLQRKYKDKETVDMVTVKVESLFAGSEKLAEAKPGGLIGIATKLDPALTKGDGLVGNIIGKPGTLPPVTDKLEINYTLIKRADMDSTPIKLGEPIVISAGTSTSIGAVMKMKANMLEIKLKRPLCIDEQTKIALSRRSGQRWRLCGYGNLLGTKEEKPEKAEKVDKKKDKKNKSTE